MIDAGSVVTDVTHDYFGRLRPVSSLYDIGACEGALENWLYLPLVFKRSEVRVRMVDKAS